MAEAVPSDRFTFSKLKSSLNSNDIFSRSTWPFHELDQVNTLPLETLPPEIQSKIWQFAIPAPTLFQIRVDSQPNIFFWGIGSFTMLKVCRRSRDVALRAYELRLRLYSSQDDQGLEGLEVQSFYSWAEPGVRVQKQKDLFVLEYLQNWPPNEGEEGPLVLSLSSTSMSSTLMERLVSKLPRRIQEAAISLYKSWGGVIKGGRRR
ncbi:hypothetical protein F5882DRAFT_81034 [Hyaloscypha sp. PMI_1271]|nr:hypothetical protein F5882DRAFT_81034 [Hyaloscypha sp. PMI_1271]